MMSNADDSPYLAWLKEAFGEWLEEDPRRLLVQESLRPAPHVWIRDLRDNTLAGFLREIGTAAALKKERDALLEVSQTAQKREYRLRDRGSATDVADYAEKGHRLELLVEIAELVELELKSRGWRFDPRVNGLVRSADRTGSARGGGRPRSAFADDLESVYEDVRLAYREATGDSSHNSQGLREWLAPALRERGHPDDLLDPGPDQPIAKAIKARRSKI